MSSEVRFAGGVFKEIHVELNGADVDTSLLNGISSIAEIDEVDPFYNAACMHV